MNTSWPPRE